MASQKKVLIFTYYWPPAGGPGVQRFLKFCKYLRDFDWEPIVITPREGSYPYLDPSLAEDIPAGLEIIKTGTLEPFALYNRLSGKKGKAVSVGMIGYRDKQSWYQRLAKYVRANYFVPDARKGWKRYAVRAGRTLVEKYGLYNATDNPTGVAAMITTGPPHSSHLTGLALRERFELPWVADFRDPWTTVYYNKFFPRSERTKRVDKALEDEVLLTASAVSVVSRGLQREYADRADTIEVLYNGFDGEDMVSTPLEPSGEFHLSYIGNFKPNQNVPAIWEALAEEVAASPAFAAALRLHFTGIVDESVLEACRSLGLGDNLVVDGFVAHKEATRRMYEAAMLLFVIPQSETNHNIITGKIFEYLASNSQLLSVGPVEGDAAAVLTEAGRTAMMDYTAKAAIRASVQEAFAAWEAAGRVPVKYAEGDYMKFSRRELTRRLAALLDAAL